MAPLIRDALGLMATWSADGKLALASQGGGSTPLLFIDIAGDLRVPIRFTTIAPKCTITNEHVVYCGVLKAIPPGTVLPDDYFMRQFYSDDALIMIDIKNSRVRELDLGVDKPLDIYNPVVIDDALFFINRYDGGVYRITL